MPATEPTPLLRPPPLHPDAERLLALIRDAGRPPLETLSPPEAREAYLATRAVLQPPPDDVAETRGLDIPGPAGPLPLRFYRGHAAPDPSPCLLYLHGGGWVIGDLDSHDGVCRRLANLAACRVLAVDYRLAPEHPFPAAVDDSAAALAWLVGHAADLGVDPDRIAVGGDSAGGTLAAVLALMGRDGTAPRPAFQLLIYPATDLNMASRSYKDMTDGLPLTTATMRYFIDHYAPDVRQRADWRASPILAESLAGAAPALVVTVGHDPLADEGQAYAARLEAEGVRVAALHLSDHLHGMLTMGRVIAASDAVLQVASLALRDAWRVA